MLFFIFFKIQNIPAQSRHDERSPLLLRVTAEGEMAEWHTESPVDIAFKPHEIQEESVKTWCLLLIFAWRRSLCDEPCASLSECFYTCCSHHSCLLQERGIDGWRKHLGEVAHLLCQKARFLNSVNPWGMFCFLEFCAFLSYKPLKNCVFVSMKTPKQELNSETKQFHSSLHILNECEAKVLPILQVKIYCCLLQC